MYKHIIPIYPWRLEGLFKDTIKDYFLLIQSNIRYLVIHTKKYKKNLTTEISETTEINWIPLCVLADLCGI